MFRRPDSHPSLKHRLDFTRRRVRNAHGELDRRVRWALMPLDIQEDVGISNVKGDILVITRHDHTYRRIRSVLESEGLRCDRAGSNGEGIGFLSLANYRVVIHDQLGRDWRSTRLVRYISRYQHNIKIISLVRDKASGHRAMRNGGYSYLIGRDFDDDRLLKCLTSSLRLEHPVCQILAQGEFCNKSCVSSYLTNDDFMEELLENPDLDPYLAVVTEAEADPHQHRQADLFDELGQLKLEPYD